MDLKSKKTVIIGVSVAVLIAAAGFVAYAFNNDDLGAKLGLTTSNAQPKADRVDTMDATRTADKSASPGDKTSTSTAGTSSSTGGSGTKAGNTGGSNTGGAVTGGSTGGQTTPAEPIQVRIMWWNDSIEKEPSNPEVVVGGSTYKPKAGTSDVGLVGPCAVGKKLQLIVYPDGRSGTKIVTDFLLNSEMLADSERDAIHVEVRDNGVRVLGNPVLGFTQSYKR